MQTVVGVSFKKAGKIYYFDPSEIELRSEDKVIVETSRGIELGEVVINPKEVEEDQIVQPLKKVIRKATPKDLEQLEINIQKEKEAYTICLEKIGNHGLPMKLVDVEYTFDNNKIIFYFTADGRVDFRELVKDLASVFRTRIELRQIGVRDEAKMIGGLGPCGLELCCKTFLREFEPISIKMAKNQDLSLNPAKISGICGRLMCCLRFESDDYDETDVDEIIDDPEKLLEEEVDEYEKYMSFARRYAKQPDPVEETRKEENDTSEGTELEEDEVNAYPKNAGRDQNRIPRNRSERSESVDQGVLDEATEGAEEVPQEADNEGNGETSEVENKVDWSEQKRKKPYNKNKGGYQGNKGGKANNYKNRNNDDQNGENRRSENQNSDNQSGENRKYENRSNGGQNGENRRYENRNNDTHNGENRRYENRNNDNHNGENRRYENRNSDNQNGVNRRYENQNSEKRKYENRNRDSQNGENRKYENRSMERTSPEGLAPAKAEQQDIKTNNSTEPKQTD